LNRFGTGGLVTDHGRHVAACEEQIECREASNKRNKSSSVTISIALLDKMKRSRENVVVVRT
jgi:putative IMPACT (imprinted ancient) family translation regulator